MQSLPLSDALENSLTVRSNKKLQLLGSINSGSAARLACVFSSVRLNAENLSATSDAETGIIKACDPALDRAQDTLCCN